jgi:hypothetical protein
MLLCVCACVCTRVCDTRCGARGVSAPLIKFMIDAIEKKGCAVADDFIVCAPCGRFPGGSLFSSEPGREQIVVCEEACDQDSVNRSVAHELVHAFDYCRAYLDFSDCRQHACTEIRAANLSTDCHAWNEFTRLNWSVRGQHKVRRGGGGGGGVACCMHARVPGRTHGDAATRGAWVPRNVSKDGRRNRCAKTRRARAWCVHA